MHETYAFEICERSSLLKGQVIGGGGGGGVIKTSLLSLMVRVHTKNMGSTLKNHKKTNVFMTVLWSMLIEFLV